MEQDSGDAHGTHLNGGIHQRNTTAAPVTSNQGLNVGIFNPQVPNATMERIQELLQTQRYSGSTTSNTDLNSMIQQRGSASTTVDLSFLDESPEGSTPSRRSNLRQGQQGNFDNENLLPIPISHQRIGQSRSNSVPNSPSQPQAGNSNSGRTHPTAAFPTLPQVSPDSNAQNNPPTSDENGREGQEVGPLTLINMILNQSPEARESWREIEKYIPFMIILLIKMLFDHGSGIIVGIALVVTFYHANSVVRQQVGRQDRRNIWALVSVLVNLIACIVFLYFVYQSDQLYNCAIFLPPPRVDSFYDLIWLVGVNDFILKFVAVIFKILLVLCPSRILPYKKKGKYFLFVERTNQMHRNLAPIQIWLVYLLQGYQKLMGKILGFLLVAGYIACKGMFLLRVGKDLKKAVEKLIQTTSYGRSPTSEQLKATGGTCPICYDPFRTPTLLPCSHIFCEDCLSTWFDRERTCPLCRANVTEDPLWRDGATSQFIQFF